jgi:hypothetical protein
MNLRKAVIWAVVAVAALVGVAAAASFITYPAEYVYRVFAWRDSDAFDWQKFPEHPLHAAPTTFQFHEAPDEQVAALFAELADVEDWDAFLERNHTQAFIVIHDGTILCEVFRFCTGWYRYR